MKPQLIIFDFWKTLAHSANKEGGEQKFILALANFGIDLKTKEEIKLFFSFYLQAIWASENWNSFSEKLLDKFSSKKTEKLIKDFAVFLKENTSYEIYQDVKEIYKLPYKRVILTDSCKFFIEESELKTFGDIFTPERTKASKPDPKAFLKVLEEMKAIPKDTIMIGDDIERDINPAKNLGMKTILIDRENNLPDFKGIKINSFEQLKETVEGL